MSIHCSDCGKSKLDKPEDFFADNDTCAECEEECTRGLDADMQRITQIATRFEVWINGDEALSAIREIREITSKRST